MGTIFKQLGSHSVSPPRGVASTCRGLLVLAALMALGCGPVIEPRPLEHAYAGRLPTVPIMPSSGGIASVWGRANVATMQEGIGSAPALSVYSPAAVVAGGIELRASRFMEFRVMGDVAFANGAVDAYGNQLYPRMFAGGIGPGVVVGWSSEDSPWSLQLTFDLAVTLHGHRGTLAWRGATGEVITTTRGTAWSMEPRGTLAFGYGVAPWLRLYAQIGGLAQQQWSLDDGHYNPLGLAQVGVEARVDDVSVLIDVQYVAFDPIFERGPVLGIAFRGNLGEGPGSAARWAQQHRALRSRAWRVAVREKRRRERERAAREASEERERLESTRWERE
jgi:hypothetical protein